MADRYALATISTANISRRAALVREDRVLSLDAFAEAGNAGLNPSMSVRDLLADWSRASLVLDAMVEQADWSQAIAVEAVTFHAPVDPPRQIFCTGANYRKHVVDLTLDMNVGPEGLAGEELRRWAEKMIDDRVETGDPYVFTKPQGAVAGPNDTLTLPSNTQKPDWELELAVVIGKGGFAISRDAAHEHVAGYAIANDISARDLIARLDYKMLGTDWLRAKGQKGFLPLGPYLVPAKFVPDPYDLRIRLSVEGQLMQDENTGDMLFDIARQIEYISRYSELFPGDVICTGSPAGNGTHYNRFLRDGDLMIGEIDGLGRQSIRCVAAVD